MSQDSELPNQDSVPTHVPASTNSSLTSLMDDATENDGLRVRFALVRLQKEALELGDSAFVSSVRIETAVFVVFDSLESWEEHQMQLLGEILEADLPYLRLRAQTTNASMRARYLHAIASVTRRRDDGRTAAKAYLEAISFYRTHSEDHWHLR